VVQGPQHEHSISAGISVGQGTGVTDTGIGQRRLRLDQAGGAGLFDVSADRIDKVHRVALAGEG
jgi:hypothetical protein